MAWSCCFVKAFTRRFFHSLPCRSRDIEPTRAMIDDPELRARSRERYGDLRLDTGGAALDFDADFQAVSALYHAMPWPP